MKLSREKVTFSICVVRNFSTRLWSFIVASGRPSVCVEERHGKFQQFDEEVGYQGDIDAHADMEQYPSADKIHTGAAYGQYELSQQDQVNDSQILMGNTYIYDGLCKKRENKL